MSEAFRALCRRPTVQGSSRIKVSTFAHCTPSSKWGPVGDTDEIMAVRKGIGHTLPHKADDSVLVSSLTGISQKYQLYIALTFTFFDLILYVDCIMFKSIFFVHNNAFFYHTVRPFIVNPLPKTTIAIEGKTKTIECTFKAKPSPTVTWYLDGLAVVSGSSRFQVHTNITENPRNLTLVQSAFTINNAMLNDTGALTCVAEHSVGNSSSSTNIVVHCEYIHLHIIFLLKPFMLKVIKQV